MFALTGSGLLRESFKEQPVLARTDDIPLICSGQPYSGKVRTVYWLGERESLRVAEERGYDLAPDALLGVMIISDRLSAFECNWQGEGGLAGVPGKGAALNAISLHWFSLLEREGLASHHVLEAPHPLVWIVQRARPFRFEAIVRRYLAGSLARAYRQGQRRFCGLYLPDGLQTHQPLRPPLFTPSTKGTLYGLEGIPEEEDTPVSAEQIVQQASAFGLDTPEHLQEVEQILSSSIRRMASVLEEKGQILADTKVEFGYLPSPGGGHFLALIDEIGTPDSSRFWDKRAYEEGEIAERCKEGFRQFLLAALPQDLLLDPSRLAERRKVAASFDVPAEEIGKVAQVYHELAEQITGQPLSLPQHPREEILDLLCDWRLIR